MDFLFLEIFIFKFMPFFQEVNLKFRENNYDDDD